MRSLVRLVAVSSLVLAAPVLAQEQVEASVAGDGPVQPKDATGNLDRLLPLSESAGTNPTQVRAQTTGRAAMEGSATTFRLAQSVEVVPVANLAVRATAEFRGALGTTGSLTPEVQARYQFLRQDEHGLNGAGGLRYKQVGFNPNGGEVEAFVAGSRTFGQWLGSVNVVAGRGLAEKDFDLEGVVGLGFRPTSRLLVGVNGRVKTALEDEKDRAAAGGGRAWELISGGVVGYTAGVFEASLLAGYQMPRGTTAGGPIAALTMGLNF